MDINDEGFCNCASCGEEIVVPIDLSAGPKQQVIEHCSACQHPNVIRIEVDDSGDVRVGRSESTKDVTQFGSPLDETRFNEDIDPQHECPGE